MNILPPPELSSDIQRALQQAVGQANDAFISHQVIDQPGKSKRKRRRDGAITEEGRAAKQKKKHAAEAVHTTHQETSSDSAVESKKSKKASSKPSTPDLVNTNESLVPSSPSRCQPPEAFLDAVVSAASAPGAPSESPYNFPPSFDQT